MAIKPIQFETAAVRAILDGRKSEMREVVKPQPILAGAFWKFAEAMWSEGVDGFRPMPGHSAWNRMPYHPGDVLWVREDWNACNSGDENDHQYCYRADGRHYRAGCLFHEKTGWCSARYMPKEAARIFLRVSDVWIEQFRTQACGGLFDVLWVWVVQFERCDMPKDWCRAGLHNEGERHEVS